MESVSEIIREARNDYAFALRGCGEKLGHYLKRIEAADARRDAELERWRKQALEENALADLIADNAEIPVSMCRACIRDDGNDACPYCVEPDGCNRRDLRARAEKEGE